MTSDNFAIEEGNIEVDDGTDEMKTLDFAHAAVIDRQRRSKKTHGRDDYDQLLEDRLSAFVEHAVVW